MLSSAMSTRICCGRRLGAIRAFAKVRGMVEGPSRALARHAEEPGLPHRFKAAVRNPRGARFFRADPLTEPGEQDEPGAGNGRVGLDCACESQTVHFRHLHIQECQVVRFAFCCRRSQELQGFSATSRAIRLHSPGKNLAAKNFAISRIVIDHEHLEIE